MIMAVAENASQNFENTTNVVSLVLVLMVGMMANGLVGMSDMRDLKELLSKLNTLAEEFVPPSVANNHGYFGAGGVGYAYNGGNYLL
nr:hypothetical protein CFP56_61456 [Quercus suber]